MFSCIVLLIEFCILAMLNSTGFVVKSYSEDEPIIWIMIILFSLAYLIDLAMSKRSKIITISFLGGYALRLGLLFFDIFGRNIYTLPNSGGDSEGFYHAAVRIANGGAWDDIEISSFAGMIFREIGISRLYMQFIFLCFSLATLFVVNRLLEILNLDLRRQQIAMLILCFLPNYAILSVLFLRESLITMMVAVSLMFFVKWLVGQSEWYFWLSFLPVLFAAMFHSGVVGILIGYCLVRLLYNRKMRKFKLSAMTMASTVVVGLLVVFLFNNYGDIFFEKMQNMEGISDIGSTIDMGGSSYAQYVGDSNTLLNMIVYSPIRMIMFQFTPFVWQIRSLSDIIAIFFNALFYIVVWYKTIKYVTTGMSDYNTLEHRTVIIALLIVWFTTTFVFAWGVTNVGTAIRHRDKMVSIAVVLLGLVLNNPKMKKRCKRRGMR